MANMTDGTCPFCKVSQTVYLESPRWRLMRHLDPVPIAGWMMIASRAHRSGLDAMTDEEAAEVGTILAAVAAAVRSVTGAERTYGVTFNEAVPHLHLHVIPRHAGDPSTTSWALADRYRATARKELAPADAADAERAAREIAQCAFDRLRTLGFEFPAAS
jgi:diadenosine tetraphosphate (Ap4A) HIT family hydrolase